MGTQDSVRVRKSGVYSKYIVRLVADLPKVLAIQTYEHPWKPLSDETYSGKRTPPAYLDGNININIDPEPRVTCVFRSSRKFIFRFGLQLTCYITVYQFAGISTC